MASEIGGDRLQQLAVRWAERSVGLVERALRLAALLQGGRFKKYPPTLDPRSLEMNHREKIRKPITQHVARKEVIQHKQHYTAAKQNHRRKGCERTAFFDFKRSPLESAKDGGGKIDQQPEAEISQRGERANQRREQDGPDVLDLVRSKAALQFLAMRGTDVTSQSLYLDTVNQMKAPTGNPAVWGRVRRTGCGTR